MVLHAIYAANHGAEKIVVRSPDTDVLVLLLHHRADIHAKEVFFLTGRTGKHANLTRYIPIHTLFTQMPPNQLRIMMAVYCMSGSDTTSAFHGRGKKTAFKLMVNHANDLQAMDSIGTGPLSRSQKEACVRFVGLLYGQKDCSSLDELRTKKAGLATLPKKLPPTEDSLYLHAERCAYQLMVWLNAPNKDSVLPDPTLFGYYRDDTNTLKPVLMRKSPAAPELLNDFVCNCKEFQCNMNTCNCATNEQPCTSACNCEARIPQIGDSASDTHCTNQLTLDALYNDTDSDSD